MTYLILIVLVVGALREGLGLFRKGQTWTQRGVKVVASALILVGMGGFLAPFIARDWPQASFEWPVGTATNALAYKDGTLVVPHEPSGRIQIYDASHAFVRGWYLESGGSGTFKVVACDEASFYVYTARGNHRYQFDFLGTTLSSTTYT